MRSLSHLAPRLALAWAVLCLAAGLGSPALGAPPSKDSKHVAFEATVSSLDPFSSLNAVDRKAETAELHQGETFLVTIRGKPLDGFYTYPLTRKAPDQDDNAQVAKVTVKASDELVPLYPFQESETEWKDPGFGLEPMLVHKEPFTWTQEVYIKPTAKVGSTLDLMYQIHIWACKESCVPEDHTLTVKVKVAEGPPEPVTPEITQRLNVKPAGPTVVPAPPGLRKGREGTSPKTEVGKGSSVPGSAGAGSPGGWFWDLLGAVGVALVGGYVSLLTPCVFPMIPITVSYFLKQSEAKHGSALLMAAVYSGTIVLVLAIGGMALLEVFYRISTHYLTNFAIGTLFLFFALSLLGMYDITLPSFLQDATAARQGRGGLVGVFFMGLTFSIISFACVGPIYGGFIAYKAADASAAGFLQRLLPVLAYSVAFASPFFLLALFPGFLRTMPKAGSWMNTIKVVMGFLELAAVVKFLRAGELLWTGQAEYLSYDVSLGLYVALSLACGLYLLGLYRLPHDHDAAEPIGVLRLMVSLGFITLALYLLPGLFKADNGESQRPRGVVFAWVDSFLLPDPESPAQVTTAHKGEAASGLRWQSKLDEALAEAKKENKLVFVDFTGTGCTNCKLNERRVFPLPEVQAALARHVLLRLYTDTTPAGIEQQPNEKGTTNLTQERFGTAAVPIYALLQPEGDSFTVLRVYGQNGNGLIKNVPEFVHFVADD